MTWPVALVLAALALSGTLVYVASIVADLGRRHIAREQGLDREALAKWRALSESVERIDRDREGMWLAIHGLGGRKR